MSPSPHRSALHALDAAQWVKDHDLLDVEPWQETVLRSTALRLGLLCCRQAGKSTVASLIAMHTAVHQPESLSVIIAPTLRQAGETFRKADTFAAKLGLQRVEDSASTLTLKNDARIVVVPGTEASRGFSAPRLVILDEASRLPDDVVNAVRPMLASGGRFLMLSTPRGRRGAFHAAAQSPDWTFVSVRADQLPARFSPSFLEQERRAMGARTYGQEYENQFNETEVALFNYDELAKCIDPTVQPLFPVSTVAWS
jgi:helicase-like protein